MNTAPDLPNLSDLRRLTGDFFTLFGAHARDDGDEGLQVRLPPDLAAHFGKDRLYLVFSADDLSPYEDLVVYGSRIFDRMMAWLEGRGEYTRWRLPVRALDRALDDGPPPELTFANCVVEQAHACLEETLFFVFNFRLIYTADDRREEIHTVVLDADGRPRPDVQSALILPPTDVSDDAARKALRFVDIPPAKSPGPARLAELAEQAQSLAVAHAEAQAVTLEANLQQRLQRVLVRLTFYYRRQIDEIAARDEARAEEARRVMEQDLQRKIADELENHRLRVQVRLVSTAQVGRPVWRYQLGLKSRHATHTLALQRDLHSGDLTPILCHACGRPTTEIALCAAGHVVGADCVRACRDCKRDVCVACGLQDCAVCGEPVCHECKSVCHLCGGWACRPHACRCPICGEETCTAHSFECKVCGQRYCAGCQDRRRVCQTCAALKPAQEEDLAGWPAELAEIQQRYPRWRVGQNTRYRLYVGTRLMGRAVIVQDQETGEVLSSNERGLRGHLVRRLWRTWR
jgi:hypothetical protein